MGNCLGDSRAIDLPLQTTFQSRLKVLGPKDAAVVWVPIQIVFDQGLFGTDQELETITMPIYDGMDFFAFTSDIRDMISETPLTIRTRDGVTQTISADFFPEFRVGSGSFSIFYHMHFRVTGENIEVERLGYRAFRVKLLPLKVIIHLRNRN